MSCNCPTVVKFCKINSISRVLDKKRSGRSNRQDTGYSTASSSHGSTRVSRKQRSRATMTSRYDLFLLPTSTLPRSFICGRQIRRCLNALVTCKYQITKSDHKFRVQRHILKGYKLFLNIFQFLYSLIFIYYLYSEVIKLTIYS